MRWTRSCRKTCGTPRTVKPCGSGSPMLESSLRNGDVGPAVRHAAQAMVAKKPGTPGRARSSRKAIAQGVPDVSADLYRLVGIFLFSPQGLRVRPAPGIPCALFIRRATDMHHSDADRAAGMVLHVL